MIDINKYTADLISECTAVFGERFLYAGLQGSYLRGEANENSDIDIMMIIERFSVCDMDKYRSILGKIGHSDRSCGFICGRDEMMRWNPLEIISLKNTTKDLYGCLSEYLPEASRADEINFVKYSLGNLYHEICHRYIHAGRGKSIDKFRGTCKGLFFLIQNIHYLESGRFIPTKKELKEAVTEDDREMLDMTDLPDGFDFDSAFSALFQWCKNAFRRIDELR